MTALLDGIALGLSAAALIAAGVVLVVTRRPAAALPVLLEFLTAAGLVRLAAEPTWSRLLGAAAVVAVRRLLVGSLGAGAASGRRPGRRPPHTGLRDPHGRLGSRRSPGRIDRGAGVRRGRAGWAGSAHCWRWSRRSCWPPAPAR